MVVHDLVRRLRFMAVLNLVLAPFVIVFLFMYFFFRYAEVLNYAAVNIHGM